MMWPYDVVAEFYDEEMGHNTSGLDVPWYVSLATKAHATLGGPVLELGAGTGRITLPLAATGLTVWDRSRPMLTELLKKARAAELEPRLRLMTADIGLIKLNQSFAAILRTFDLKHPFPEEFIRQAITPLAQPHFAPTPTAVANLIQAGVAPRSVFMTGNTIVDHLKHTLNGEPAGVVPAPFILVTLHRRELASHIDSVVSGLLAALEGNVTLRATVVLHPNPLISTPLRERLRGRPNIELISPLPNRQFLEVVRATSAVVTDSGGVQEEAAILGKPLVVVRKVTERPEIMLGTRAIIAGFDPIAIKEAIDWAISLQAVRCLQRWFGDGYAAERIVDVARQFLSARQSKKNN